MSHKALAGPADLFHGQFDAEVVTLLAIVEGGDRPGHLGPFGVVGGVGVAPVGLLIAATLAGVSP